MANNAAVTLLVIQDRSQAGFFYDSLLLICSSVELPDPLLFTTAILIWFSLLGVQELLLLAQYMSLWKSMKDLLKKTKQSGISQPSS